MSLYINHEQSFLLRSINLSKLPAVFFNPLLLDFALPTMSVLRRCQHQRLPPEGRRMNKCLDLPAGVQRHKLNHYVSRRCFFNVVCAPSGRVRHAVPLKTLVFVLTEHLFRHDQRLAAN